MIEIDGSIGGGQILRTSLSLSTLTRKPFRMINIRGKREKSGLQPQHLVCVNSTREICNAKVKGNELHSNDLEFIPNKIRPGNYTFDIGTAGSTAMVFQTLLFPLVFSNELSYITIKGGTANTLAPAIIDLQEVFSFWLKKMDINFSLDLVKEGFYPKGGGIIRSKIYPCNNLKELIAFERGDYISSSVFSVSSSRLEKAKVSERMIDGFKNIFDKATKIKQSYVDSLNNSCYIFACSKFDNSIIGFTCLGKIGVKSEIIGSDCAKKLLEEINSDAVVDYCTADQLLIYIAMKGSGVIKTSKITSHIETNIQTIEKFLDVKFEIVGNIIKCKKVNTNLNLNEFLALHLFH